MEETISQGGTLVIASAAACAVISTIMLLMSSTDAGLLRHFMVRLLEAAC